MSREYPFRIDPEIDQEFVNEFRNLLKQFNSDHYVQHRVKGYDSPLLLNFRLWEQYQVFLHSKFQSSDRVLDCGALHTYFSLYISQFVKEIFCIDNFYWASRSYIDEWNLPSPEEWMRFLERNYQSGRIYCERADLMSLRFPDSFFDKIVCISTIEHVINDVKAMKEMERVLIPGGTLLLTTELSKLPKSYSESDGTYYRLYSKDGIKDLIESTNLSLVPPILLSRSPQTEKFVQCFFQLIKE